MVEVVSLVVPNTIAYSKLKKYVWYNTLPVQQTNGEELFRFLLQNKIYVEGFATDCKELVGSRKFGKLVVDINDLNKVESVVFAVNQEEASANDIIKTVYRINPILKARRAVIWGTGNNGKSAYKILVNNGVKIKCFIDVDKTKNMCMGVPVYGMDELDKLDTDTVLIEAYDKYYEMDRIVRDKYPCIIHRFYCDIHSRYILYRKQGEEKALFGIAEYERLNFDKLYGKQVKIYGVGEDAVELSCYLRLMDFDFTAYLYDEIIGAGFNTDGYPIERVEEILYKDNYAIWILCQETEHAKKRLKELGVCLDLDVVMPRKRVMILDANIGYIYDTEGYYTGMMIYGQERRSNYRIAVLGGSTTDGGNWNFNKSWPQLLYEKINYKNITIYNAGVSGYASGQELIRLVRDILPLEPDMVLVYDGANDSGGDFFPEEPFVLHYARRIYEFVAEHMEEDFFQRVNEGILVNYGIKSNSGRFGNWLSNMESMRAICKAKGISFYGFMQPMLLSKASYNVAERQLFEQNEGVYHYMAGFRRMMEEFAVEETHPYIYDLSHIFDNVYDVYFDTCHVNEKGNQIIAVEIYKRILNEIIKKK